jgi:hypothetical protein
MRYVYPQRGKGSSQSSFAHCVVCRVQIVLETEITNTAAMKLYERLGFLRSKRLHRYYLNGNSAYRLVLYLKEGVGSIRTSFDPYGLPPAPLPTLDQILHSPATAQGNGS